VSFPRKRPAGGSCPAAPPSSTFSPQDPRHRLAAKAARRWRDSSRAKCAHARGAAENSGYHNDRIRMHVTLIMAKPRSVALKTAEDPGREGFAAEGSIPERSSAVKRATAGFTARRAGHVRELREDCRHVLSGCVVGDTRVSAPCVGAPLAELLDCLG
jgi:hypothetical protein